MTTSSESPGTGDATKPHDALAGLIERLRTAKEGSRELDGRMWCLLTPNREFIATATNKDKWGQFDPSAFNPNSSCCDGMVFRRTDYTGTRDDIRQNGGEIQQFMSSPAYTTDLSAIVALVGQKLPVWIWAVSQPGNAWLTMVEMPPPPTQVTATGETPCLALCLALLLALQSEVPHV